MSTEMLEPPVQLAARAPSEELHRRGARRRRIGDISWHVGAAIISILWFLPILLVISTSFRTFDDVAANGIAAFPSSFTLNGYESAWTDGGAGRALVNSFLITIPALFLTLLLASMAAFGLSRFNVPFRRTILLLMLAGNLLPPQIILVPVNKISEALGIYDTLWAPIILHVSFGMGFYVFVLYGFMRAIPSEVQQAATVDGAGAFQIYWRIILPLSRPALAALGALGFTWIFNDLLWAITVLRSETKMPVTPALLGLQGAFLSDWGLIAAATVIAAIPTVIVFLTFQRQFIGGLTLGSVK